MSILEKIVLYSAAIAFFVIAVYVIRIEKGWWKTIFPIPLAFSFALFLCGQTWFQGFLETQIVSTVLSATKQFGEKLNEYHKTTGEMQSQVDDAQKKLRSHQTDIDRMQQALKLVASDISTQQIILSSIQLDIKNQQVDLHKILEKASTAQTMLDQQQKQIANVEQLTRRLFSQMTVDTFSISDTNSVVLGKKVDDGALVGFFQLSKTPVRESMRLQQGGMSLLPDSYILSGSNIVGIAWKIGTDPESMKNERIYIHYVADPTTPNARSTISFNEKERILIDGRLFHPEIVKYRK